MSAPAISPNVVILTRAELRAREDAAFQRGFTYLTPRTKIAIFFSDDEGLEV